MRVDKLRQLLAMFSDDTEIYIQTVPEDFASPLESKNIAVWPATPDSSGGNIIGINREKVVFTAHFPERKKHDNGEG